MSAQAIPIQRAPAPSGLGNALLLRVAMGALGNSKQVASSFLAEAAGVDPAMLRVRKLLLDSPELEALTNWKSRLKKALALRAVPSGYLRPGTYGVGLTAVPAVDKLLQQALAELPALVDALLEAYPRRKAEAAEKLGPRFNAGDYPNPEKIRAAFSLTWQWFDMESSFNAPDRLKEISRDIWEREQLKAEAGFAEAQSEYRAILREMTKELVDHLYDRLTGSDGKGKPKVFRNTMLTNLNDFLETFNTRNLTEDRELQGLVQQMRELTNGVDADSLRDSPRLRVAISDKVAEIKGALDGMLRDRPRRTIQVGEEED